ncbi:MAG TPA: ribonuclease III [Candidatus Dorea gallistercoris]|uniref:Ribonuclease 3 n=1 Tax=Candidatus Dorea gallistercoris TaxID=2838542 RepID=A0A9D1RAJ4_9FIRM|nr:ribonuclease III [Candidatus Dorea gallistercoris]
MGKDLRELERKTGYRFRDFRLLELAMTHKSYVNEAQMEKYESNERLEFLGDAVLELVTSEFLFQDEGNFPEGELTRMRASIVCEPSLAFCARELDLGSYLMMGRGEEATGGRKRDSLTSDGLEALIGAIYMDGGLTSAKEFIHRTVLNDLEKKKLFFDSKTILQEVVQARFREQRVSYQLLVEEGPDHNKSFQTAVYIGEKVYGTGTGHTKKRAEQEAAYRALLALKKRDIK